MKGPPMQRVPDIRARRENGVPSGRTNTRQESIMKLNAEKPMVAMIIPMFHEARSGVFHLWNFEPFSSSAMPKSSISASNRVSAR